MKETICLFQRSVSEITYEEAYQLCLDLYRTKAVFNMSNDLPGISINVSIDTCANDLTVSMTMI